MNKLLGCMSEFPGAVFLFELTIPVAARFMLWGPA